MQQQLKQKPLKAQETNNYRIKYVTYQYTVLIKIFRSFVTEIPFHNSNIQIYLQ